MNTFSNVLKISISIIYIYFLLYFLLIFRYELYINQHIYVFNYFHTLSVLVPSILYFLFFRDLDIRKFYYELTVFIILWIMVVILIPAYSSYIFAFYEIQFLNPPRNIYGGVTILLGTTMYIYQEGFFNKTRGESRNFLISYLSFFLIFVAINLILSNIALIYSIYDLLSQLPSIAIYDILMIAENIAVILFIIMSLLISSYYIYNHLFANYKDNIFIRKYAHKQVVIYFLTFVILCVLISFMPVSSFRWEIIMSLSIVVASLLSALFSIWETSNRYLLLSIGFIFIPLLFDFIDRIYYKYELMAFVFTDFQANIDSIFRGFYIISGLIIGSLVWILLFHLKDRLFNKKDIKNATETQLMNISGISKEIASNIIVIKDKDTVDVLNALKVYDSETLSIIKR